MLAQDPPQPFWADPDPPDAVAGQVAGELAKTPARERLPQFDGADRGRHDDELTVLIADQAGTASRSPRVQRGQPSC